MGSRAPSLAPRSGGLGFGPPPLVDDAALAIAERAKSSLVRPGGAGKSGLLKTPAGRLAR